MYNTVNKIELGYLLICPIFTTFQLQMRYSEIKLVRFLYFKFCFYVSQAFISKSAIVHNASVQFTSIRRKSFGN